MGIELICPDCGGVIGADENDPRPKCRCEGALSLDDTEVELQAAANAAQGSPAAPIPVTPAPAAGPKKLCCVCGRDVTHEKRAKDEKGYWCYDCHKADRERQRGGPDKARARCPECGRLVPAESIATLHGITMCAKCRVEQDELPNHLKLKYRRRNKEEPAEQKAAEKKRILILSVVFGILVIIIVLARLGVL
ncbi:MAG: hypothetical protein ABSH22_05410 [Tepidisphaeraceae bacterium]|jgi:hypothetical protein